MIAGRYTFRVEIRTNTAVGRDVAGRSIEPRPRSPHPNPPGRLISDHPDAARWSARAVSGVLQSHFKQGTRPVEADIEFHEDVDLPQQDRYVVGPGPGERESDLGELADDRGDDERPGLAGREIAAESHRRALLLPVRPQWLSHGMRQDIDRGAGVQQTLDRDRVRAGQRDRE
jgi:hypothetical protein